MYTVPIEIKKSLIEGRGYFAAEDIPTGTIVYCYSKDDIRYTPDQFEELNNKEKSRVVNFAVEDEFGNWVETSTGAFTNHSCNPNIMPLFVAGIYCDIAIRDIKKGEEITIDYSLFYSSQTWSMSCHCGANSCRHKVGFGVKIPINVEEMWQKDINNAIKNLDKVHQPLFDMTDELAKELSLKIKSFTNITVAKYIKFSLIARSN